MSEEKRDNPITAAQLIAALQTLPPETKIMVSGYEGGVADATLPSLERLIAVRRNVHSVWYYGAHEALNDRDEGFATAEKDSVLL